MYKEWLQKRVTVAEAEAAHLIHDDRLGPVPFGFINEPWSALLAQMQESDELWEFRSPRESWAIISGRAGIALIRDSNVIAFVVTSMN